MKSAKDLPVVEALVDAVAEGAPFDALGVVAAEVPGVRAAVGVDGRARRRDFVGAVGAVLKGTKVQLSHKWYFQHFQGPKVHIQPPVFSALRGK